MNHRHHGSDDIFSAQARYWWDPRGPMATLHALQELRAAYLREREPELRDSNVLDVGTGGGLMAEEFARRGAHVTGTDRSQELLSVAREHAAQSGLAIRYLGVELDDLAGREAESYDVVSAFEVIEHVADPETFLASLSRLLRPGGRLYLSTINRTTRSWLFAIVAAEYLLGIVPRGTHRHADFRRPSEIAAWGRAHDLHVVDLRGVRYDPLTRRATFSRDVSVNYLMCLVRRSMAVGA
ncbi:MAG: bifunctional 2-polyprenyl-6-hydroxyphenol methylase/3-demethylubiquinol 3-O-methyltransferase UbiG [Candidatus Micrarchaeaceae archaeon]